MSLSSKPGFFARYKFNLRDILHSSHADLLGSKAIEQRAPSTVSEVSGHTVNTEILDKVPPVFPQSTDPESSEAACLFIDLAANADLPAIPSYSITHRHSAPALLPRAVDCTFTSLELPDCSPRDCPMLEPSVFVRVLQDASHQRQHLSIRLHEAEAKIDQLVTEAKGNTHHIRHLHDQHQTKDEKLHHLRKESVRMIVSIVVLKQRNQTLRAHIDHLEFNRRVCTRVIHEGTRKQMELQGDIRELERQRERDCGALKAVKARTWVPGWCWKAKIAESTLRLDAAEMQARGRGSTIAEQDAEIVELREELGEYR
ncbi:hypothetical protein LTR12_014794 [Friedmanniomyces endolithicus]|nr:hypothetical protein LTR12_014794 [Friedmanniomyces endolithicus]